MQAVEVSLFLVGFGGGAYPHPVHFPINYVTSPTKGSEIPDCPTKNFLLDLHWEICRLGIYPSVN
jgi:hypothetical protein